MIQESGTYRVRFKVGAQQVGDDRVRFEVRLGDRKLGPFAVTAKSQAEQWVETECELSAGEYDWQVWFVNEHSHPDTHVERWFWLHEFTIAGPLEGSYGLERKIAIQRLEKTARLLFRRSLNKAEKDKIYQVFDTTSAAGFSPREALQLGLETLEPVSKHIFPS